MAMGMTMTAPKNQRQQREIDLTRAEMIRAQDAGVGFKIATIHQTLGPNWQNIYWLVSSNGKARRCYAAVGRDFAEVVKLAKG